MSDSIAVVFSAQTGQFVASVEGMDAAVAKSAETVAAAKNAILKSYQQQSSAAAEQGASAEKLASMQEKAAARLSSVTEENAQRIINSIQRISDKQKAVASELANLKVPEAKEGDDITNKQRASALLRGGGIRAGESFLTQFGAFNALSSTIFPALGLAAIGEEAVKLGKELYDAFDLGGTRARQTASEIREVNNSMRDENTSLDVQIDKLQEEQAKLEKKPFNGLKLTLDEAAESAQKLTTKLDEVFAAQLKVLQGMAASTPQKIFSGGSDTHQEQVMLQEHQKWISAAQSPETQLNESKSYANSLQTRLAELKQKQADNNATMANASRQGVGSLPLTSFNEEIRATQQLIQWQQVEQQTIEKTIALQKQQAATQGARDKHNDALLGHGDTEAANKAAEARLKSMEAYVSEWKLQAPVDAKALYDYWEVQRSAFTIGSNQYNTVVAKQAQLAEEGARRVHEGIAKFIEEQKKLSVPLTLDRNVSVVGNSDASARGLQNEYAKSALSGDEVTASVARTKVQIDLANGSISQLTATQRLAAISAGLHAQRLADLDAQIEQLKKDGSYDFVTDRFASDKDQSKYVELQAQKTKEAGQASVEAMQSAATAAGQSWSGALIQANNLWVQSAQDSASQVKSIFDATINGFNDSLVNLITGKKSNWSQLFTGIGGMMAKDGLQQGEAALLGKHSMSSASNLGGMASLASLFHSKKTTPDAGTADLLQDGADFSGDDAVAATISSFMSKIGGWFSSIFGGNRAIGGGVSVGHVYRINEKPGQEFFAPSVNGTMIPANAAGSMFGGGSSAMYTINVQKGVTPEEFHQGVTSALQQYHTQVMPHGARAAVSDGNSRRGSRR
ncbi:phage tail tape measure C-terminal domain-containing protein [Granulicella cerasi]|uniref:Phage tail tape measure C-terminal domain-containing protein n=1 Tax=Granulicella cerasi TaxID=741063 RepID=A0ABW1Z6Q0_9BACT|nr:phage tail tape measure C-terminal domain-containing protein [Granulicella cerasi]